MVILYHSARLTVSDPAYRAAVTSALAGLPRREVPSASTYWSTRPPRSASLVSRDRHGTYAVLQLAAPATRPGRRLIKAIRAELAPPGLAAHGITAQVGGTVPTEVAINSEVTANIGKAEGFSMPVLLILLLIIFGGLAAASLPLAIGGTAILGSFTVLRLLTVFTTVSIYSVNITTIIGLGLGIDYGLFMVVRFREELRRQPTTEAAVARTVATAGRTIAVSGVTVAVALTSLMLFPEVFLRSMGYGGVATVVVDMVAALTILPALLSVLGPRVNALRVRRSLRPQAGGQHAAAEAGPVQAGGWYRLAHGVMRRPVAFVVVITVALLALGLPFLRISWGGTDARALPATAQARQVTEALNRDFPVNSTSPIEAVVTLPGPASGPAGQRPSPPTPAGSRISRVCRACRSPRSVVSARASTSATRPARSPRRPGRPCSGYAPCRPRPAPRYWSAGPPPSSLTNCPASAPRCPGWRCWWSSPRSCCCSWRSVRWSCR